MPSLTNFTQADAEQLGGGLAKMGDGAGSMEEAANQIVRHLYENITENGNKACALVRLYKTHAYNDLDPELRNFAEGILGRAPDSQDMKCLTLLATAGEKEEWNSRAASQGHKAIPLPSEDFVSKIPMISRLVSQFGLDVNAVIKPDPSLLVDLEQKQYNVFHVPEAVGSPYIPAQKEFVIAHGIQSVLGFGGVLGTGDLFAVIMFAKVHIPRTAADAFHPVALNVKEAIQPFAEKKVFSA